MKVKCKISHELSFEGGGFRRYEAGQTYDIEEPDMEFFENEAKNKGTVPEAEQSGDVGAYCNTPLLSPKSRGGKKQ